MGGPVLSEQRRGIREITWEQGVWKKGLISRICRYGKEVYEYIGCALGNYGITDLVFHSDRRPFEILNKLVINPLRSFKRAS